LRIADQGSQFFQRVRIKYPVLYGVMVGAGLGLVVLLATILDAPLVHSAMAFFDAWFPFALYTILIFGLPLEHYHSRSPSMSFYTLFATLLLLHLVCCVWFILRVRPFGAIGYGSYGAFEVLLLVLLLEGGMRYLDLNLADD